MRTLVTGASGLIGSHVAREVAATGVDVRSFDEQPPPEAAVDEHVAGDVRDPDAVRKAMEGCDAVLHLAALYSYERHDGRLMEDVNVGGTRCVLDAAARHGVRRIVVTSSCATCGPVPGRIATETDSPPQWELRVPYKRSKLRAEALALAAAAEGHDVVVVNPTTVVGPGDRRPTPSGRMVLDVVLGRARAYLPRAGINVVAVDDVARGHVAALERGRSGERYLLGGDNLTLRDAFAMIARHAGRAEPRLPLPYPLVRTSAAVAEGWARLTGRSPELVRLDEVRLARLPAWFSSAKAQRELGYAWCPAEEALAAAVAWFQSGLR